jgi:hypothetical protein
MIIAEKLVKLLGLKPYSEGGYCLKTYRSDEIIKKGRYPSAIRGIDGMERNLLLVDPRHVFCHSPNQNGRDSALLSQRPCRTRSCYLTVPGASLLSATIL